MALTKDQRQTLVANIVSQYEGFQAESLEVLTDNQLVGLARPAHLDKLVDVANAAATKEPVEMDEDEEDDEEDTVVVPNKGKKAYNGKDKMAANASDPKAWWDAAPAEVKRLVANAQRVEKKHRDELISRITANGASPLSAEALAKRSTEDLEVFAQFAANSVASGASDDSLYGFDFSGLAEPVTVNAGASKPLALPGADYMNEN